MQIAVGSIPSARSAIRVAAVAVALALVGAAPNPYPNLAKSDRVPSPADCRDRGAAAIDCLGVVLPSTEGEIIEVAPGLSLVAQIPG